jgi:hypothetical protein
LALEVEQRFATAITDDRNPREWIDQVLNREGAPTFEMVGTDAAADFLTMAGYGLSESELRFAIEKYKAAKPATVPEFAVDYLRAVLKRRIDEGRELPSPSNLQLRDEIERLFEEDQQIRQTKGIASAETIAVDARHLPVLEALLDQYGVPTFDAVGRQAANHFVLMLQHMPARLRDRGLPLLKKNVDAGQASPIDFAMEFDRTENDHGRPQIYGENFHCSAEKKFVPYPTADTDQLAKRRAELGLEPIESKTRMIQIIYGDSICK